MKVLTTDTSRKRAPEIRCNASVMRVACWKASSALCAPKPMLLRRRQHPISAQSLQVYTLLCFTAEMNFGELIPFLTLLPCKLALQGRHGARAPSASHLGPRSVCQPSPAYTRMQSITAGRTTGEYELPR